METETAADALQSASLEVLALDCDGVLFDSKKANIRFYDHVLEQVGAPPINPEQEEYIHMHPVRESLQHLLGKGGLYKMAWDYLQGFDFTTFNKYLTREPGLVDLLKLAKPNRKIALATNRTVSTHELLAHFQLDMYFDLVVCASDVTHPKPHPEIMERVLETFDVPPEQVLFVGDSALDEQMAWATGVFFAAYKNPRLKAHVHVAHFDELQPFVGNGKTLESRRAAG